MNKDNNNNNNKMKTTQGSSSSNQSIFGLEEETSLVLKKFGRPKSRAARRPSTAVDYYFSNSNSNSNSSSRRPFTSSQHDKRSSSLLLSSSSSMFVTRSGSKPSTTISKNNYNMMKRPTTHSGRYNDNDRPWTCRNISDATKRLVTSSSHDLSTDSNKQRLFGEDGTQNTKLRDTIDSVLSKTKFDSVPDLITIGRFRSQINELEKDHNNKFIGHDKLSLRDVKFTGFETKQDLTPFHSNNDNHNLDEKVKNNSNTDNDVFDKHNGNEMKSKTKNETQPICFNCWSSSNSQKCDLHRETLENTHETLSETTVLCKNWSIDALRRRYRLEEKKNHKSKHVFSLEYHQSPNEFRVIKEHSHPIYRNLSHQCIRANFVSKLRYRLQIWFKSIVDIIKFSSVSEKKRTNISELLKERSTIRNLITLSILKKNVVHMLPRAPITGTTLSEKFGKIKTFVEKDILVRGSFVTHKFIVDGPTPVPKALYSGREYETPDAQMILIEDCDKLFFSKEQSEIAVSNAGRNPFEVANHIISQYENNLPPTQNSLDETETLVIKSNNFDHIVTGDDAKKFQADLKTLKFATLSRTESNRNIATGGLSANLIITHIVTTRVPPHYGKFNSFNKTIYSAHSKSDTYNIKEVEIVKTPQKYVDRPLVNYISDICYKEIMVIVGLDPSEKHHSSKKESQAEENADDFGFRTVVSEEIPIIDSTISTSTFVPTEKVATPNIPHGLPMMALKADLSYPFCEIKSRKNTLDDMKHLFIQKEISSLNKPQLFTSVGIQKPGRFMRDCDMNGGLGRFHSLVTRSWPRKQLCKTRQYFTDDGIAYWYCHQSGETFWDRPFDDEEEKDVKEGGVHIQTNVPAGQSGDHSSIMDDNTVGRRIRRKLFLQKHENSEMESKRKRQIMKSRQENNINTKEMELTTIKDEVMFQTSTDFEPPNKAYRDIKEQVHPSSKIEQLNVEKPDIYIKLQNIENTQRKSPLKANILPDDEHTPDESDTDRSPKSEKSLEFLNKSDGQRDTAHKRVDNEKIVDSITQAIGDALKNLSSSEDILKLGVGLGMSLGAQGVLKLPNKNTAQREDERVTSDSMKTELSTTGEIDKVTEEASCIINESKTKLNKKSTEYVPPPFETDTKVLLPPDVDVEEDSLELFCIETESLPNNVVTQIQSFQRMGQKITADSTIKESNSENLYSMKSLLTVPKDIEVSDMIISDSRSLPKCKPVGRLKPRSSGEDWLAIGFDPWSSGRESLTVEFIPSLMPKLHSMSVNPLDLKASSISLKRSIRDTTIPDHEARIIEEQNKINRDYLNMCRFVRHNKYSELENMMNHPDCSVHIDYCDKDGNTLLMISCQNGNKRIAKLCLRKGSNINKQNTNGQSCLHYAFGYGFDDLGNYLITKGADDSMINSDGLTCYEGLNMETVEAI